MARQKDALMDSRMVQNTVERLIGGVVYEPSYGLYGSTLVMLARCGITKELIILWENEHNADAFAGAISDIEVGGLKLKMKRCGLTYENLQAAWKLIPFMKPGLLGLDPSVGLGDRLGLATPGHVQAVRQGRMRPIYCQQSIREMTRTGRSPQDVMNDACWGVMQAGWRQGFGADADHLKQTADMDRCLAAGFTFITVDPGEHVDSSADTASGSSLQTAYEALPWNKLEITAADYFHRYADKKVTLPGVDGVLTIRGEDVRRAAVKYGKAIAHIKLMYEHLQSQAGAGKAELEVSVDETATPTTVAEHYLVASELKRLGVRWVSLAPRFIGDFEKGVDYIGDLAAFRAAFAQHVGVMKALGPYKISLHSGSDKFSIYPIAAELAPGAVHLKTAGTSYLESLRAIAAVEPGLFREILDHAKQRYPEDKASYHVSAKVEKVIDAKAVRDADLPGVLDHFDTREVCHVTFGSILRGQTSDGRYLFRERFFQTLRQHEQVYYDILEKHLGRHIQPFSN